MAHYAFLDKNNIVTEVIVGKDEGDDGVDWEQHYGAFRGQTCKRTSYNTLGGVHLTGGVPFRKNFASIGYTYSAIRDAFISPKPYNSWIFNEDTCLWSPPTPMPEDAGTGYPPKIYAWDEVTQTWLDNTPTE